MQFKLKWLFLSSAAILLISAVAKICSATMDIKVLSLHDPLLLLTNRQAFWAAGSAELAVVLYLMVSSSDLRRALLLLQLSMVFILYHFFIWYYGFTEPCPCLGNVTGWLNLKPRTAHVLTISILAYLFITSIYSLMCIKSRSPHGFKSSNYR